MSAPARALTRDEIKRRLDTRQAGARSDAAGGQPYMPTLPGSSVTLWPAAVLVPLVERAGGLTVLLTLRAAHLKSHAGQISFPGGRLDHPDETPEEAALREAREEIGLARDRVELLGRLDDYITNSKYAVVPIVGLIAPPFDVAADPSEVADIFEVPLDFILDPANRRRESRIAPDGTQRAFYAMPYGERYIWGATAAMLVNLADVLGDAA